MKRSSIVSKGHNFKNNQPELLFLHSAGRPKITKFLFAFVPLANTNTAEIPYEERKTIWALSVKKLIWFYWNTNGTVQPVHPHSLISAFVFLFSGKQNKITLQFSWC